MLNTITEQDVVMRFVMKSDQMISGSCIKPCSMKQAPPIAIIRNVGKAMPSVLRVLMVVIA